MAISKNNPILKNHFRKDWQERVKTHFDQAGQKSSRRATRAKKAAAVAPRPLDLLRPIVRCPTIRYNRKTRLGRGFTQEEVEAAGINYRYARSVGISVDLRRSNRSVEGFELNVARLKEYLARLVIIPSRAGKDKKGASSAAEVAALKQASLDKVLPKPVHKFEVTTAAVSSVETTNAYETLQEARKVAKAEGKRLAKLKASAEGDK